MITTKQANLTCILLTILFVIGRLTVATRPFSKFSWNLTYEALAHLWVGILIGLILSLWFKADRLVCVYLTSFIVLFEIVCFMSLS